MASERAGQTLQPTALVHEAWLRLGVNQEKAWDGRAHFFGAAAEAMRRILIDNARRKNALRHKAGVERLDFEEIDIAAPAPDEQLLAINEALDKLAAEDRQKAELVKLRFFVGMSIEEAAQVLKISEATAKRWWAVCPRVAVFGNQGTGLRGPGVAGLAANTSGSSRTGGIPIEQVTIGVDGFDAATVDGMAAAGSFFAGGGLLFHVGIAVGMAGEILGGNLPTKIAIRALVADVELAGNIIGHAQAECLERHGELKLIVRANG